MDMERRSHNKTDRLGSRTVAAVIAGLGILSAAIYWINFKIVEIFPLFAGLVDLQLHVIMTLAAGLLYLMGVVLVLKMRLQREQSWLLTGFIIFLAIIFRLGLVGQDPGVLSSDMYRYIWDGRVQANGINPYLYPPGASELRNMRDDRIFPKINRKVYPTVYPAGAQVFFRLFYLLAGDSTTGYKAIMVFFDICTLLVLALLLQNQGLNPARIIIYAWNPLVVSEIAYSGHLEGLTVFLVVSAFYLYVIHKKLPAIVMLALSAAVKLYPALLLATLLNRGDRIKGLAACAATIALLYLPFVAAGHKLAGFLTVYLTNPDESFNLGLKYILMRMIPVLNYDLLSYLFITGLAVGGLVVLLKEKNDTEVLRYAYILTGLLMILMPAALHPWYVILIIPFLAFYPSAAWLLFSCTVALSYLKYVPPEGKMPVWILVTEYSPLFALLTAGHILKKTAGSNETAGLEFSNQKEDTAGV